ncbi:hypothetical protein ACHQM5_004619 [Ranunculus cassubicifolius]
MERGALKVLDEECMVLEGARKDGLYILEGGALGLGGDYPPQFERLIGMESTKVNRCGNGKLTTVDSGRRALQYLGLDGEKNSVGFDESSTFREIPVVIMSSENVLPRINRCLEEGAEEFIVKPVKLSDVKRLKDRIMRDEEAEVVHEIEVETKEENLSTTTAVIIVIFFFIFVQE